MLFGTGRKRHSRSEAFSLVDCHDSRYSEYELYEHGSDKNLWRYFVEGQITSCAEHGNGCRGPTKATALDMLQ